MSVINNNLLNVSSDTIDNIRKIFDLDKPGRINEAINILEEWIQKQDHIVKKDFSKDYLERVLISCKGSVEKAKRQIDRLCTMKTLIPHFFTKTNVKTQLKTITELTWITPLPQLTKDYYRVILVKYNNKPFTAESFLEFYQYCVIMAEYLKVHDYANGYMFIDDLRDINVAELITKMNTVELAQLVSMLVDGYGGRLKGIHVVTESKAIELLIKMVKQLISEKISNRINVHNTMEDLQKAIPKEVLPEEYGGKQRAIMNIHEDWLEELSSEKHIEYLKKTHKFTVDESKRCNGKFNEEYLGMPGSFRSLTVD